MAARDAGTHWLANLAIRNKLALAFAGVLLTLVGAGAGIFVALANQARARVTMQQAVTVIDAVQDTRNAMHQVETAIYDRLADSPGADAALAGARSALDASFSALLMRTSADTVLGARAVQAEQRLRDWSARAIEPLLAELGKVTGGPTRMADLHGLTQRFGELDRREGQPLLQLLSDIDTAAHANLQSRSGELEDAAGASETTVLVMLALGVAVVILALWLAGRLIVAPIRELTGLMTRLAEHDHDVVVPQQQRRDEVGAMARALDVFKQAAITTYWQNWNKTAIGEIGASLQRCGAVEEFADTLCAELARRLGAGVAVFFRYDEETRLLQRAGGYGLRERRHLETRYALGEGLTGQCARERRGIVLSPVPEDYVRIHSASGEAAPRSVTALPLLLRQRLLGVVELAAFAPFTAQQQQLLDELLPIAALSFDNLARALHTQDLLQRSQAQTHELQASEETLRVQREELRSTNDDLSAKTVELEEQQQRLQASEEELRVQAEELQASNEELRQKTETLNEQKDVLQGLQREAEHRAQELARASQYKSDFLANMSHELRTPLNSMLILSRSLADNDDGRLAPDQIESARVIFDAGSNLLRLINDILDLSKIEAGKMDVLIEPIALPAVAQNLLRTYRPLAREKELKFSVDVDAALPGQVLGDAPKLDQIVGNLVGNAIKFTREGEVRVAFAPCPADAAGSLQRPAAELFAVVVSDTGIGIPAHKLAAIFGVFEQLDASTSRQFGGSGLGLSIARRLAQLLGGDILAQSVEGRGSRFTVLLPRQAQARGAAAETVAVPLFATPDDAASAAAPAAAPRACA